MSTFNPDYPTANSGNFLQHTYQNAPQTDLYFYGGNQMNPYSSMMPNDSRRNVGYGMTPVNPVNPFMQFGQSLQTQQQSIPESSVQPFASYPPATPMGATAPMGLNSMVENSRRNIPATPTQNNPWATSTNMPMNTMPTQPMFGGGIPNNWFDNGYNIGYKIDMNTMALYGDNTFSFDKHQSWENGYTQNRSIGMPNINWQNNAQACYNQPMMPQYPIQQQAVQANWKEIAEKNWGSNNL